MANVVLLILIIFVAYIAVLVGATAYEMTGLNRETARFQALSAFTNCGFTTRASERVVEHSLRRRITTILILMGYAGTAGVIATVIASFQAEDGLSQALNIVMMLGASLAMWYFLLRRGFQAWLGDFVRRQLYTRVGVESVPHEELMHYRKGYGITRIEIPHGSRVAGKALKELSLREQRLQVLAIEDHGEVHPIPDVNTVLKPLQHVILYGRLDGIEQVFGVTSSL